MSDPHHPPEGDQHTDLDRARTWVRRYRRQIEYKERHLDKRRHAAEEASFGAHRTNVESDMILLEVQLSRLEQKRDYWVLRAAELAGLRGEAA